MLRCSDSSKTNPAVLPENHGTVGEPTDRDLCGGQLGKLSKHNATLEKNQADACTIRPLTQLELGRQRPLLPTPLKSVCVPQLTAVAALPASSYLP